MSVRYTWIETIGERNRKVCEWWNEEIREGVPEKINGHLLQKCWRISKINNEDPIII